MSGVDISSEMRRLDRLADLMDSRFRIPGTSIRFGVDTAIGVVPGLGDLVALAPSAYLVAKGVKLGARKRTLVRMAANVAIDSIVGAVPLLGDLFDLVYKANNRNVALLRADLSDRLNAQVASGWNHSGQLNAQTG